MPGAVVVKVLNLTKYFELRQGILNIGKPAAFVKAVDDVNFEIREGEILGLVGESGCGKTTTGRLLTRLEDPTGGNVFFLGRDIALLEGRDLRVFRRSIQMVFQDPYESLNPRTTVLQTIMEPLINHHIGKDFEARVKMVIKSLEDAGLAPAKEYLNRFPHELSGGQRQRVSIARALVINPRVIVADEPVSMLDVSIRAGVLNLMLDLRDKYHIPYLFITHDIAVARYVSDRLGVMYLGRVVELGETDRVIFEPKHPYTRALLSAVPVPDPEHKHGRISIKGEIPSAINIPLGCRFRPRCPFAFNECGWEAKDLAGYLVETEGVKDPKHRMEKHIDELVPDGFSLVIKVKPGGRASEVREYVTSMVSAHKDKVPMFQAVWEVQDSLGDRHIALKCSSASVSAEVVAQELVEMLVGAVDFRSREHPMFGTITDVKRDGARVVVSVGLEDPKLAPGQKTKVDTTVGFIHDFVKNQLAKGHTEFKGVGHITGEPPKRRVVVECSKARMSPKRVAGEVADMLTADWVSREGAEFSTLPPHVRRGTVRVRVNGPEKNWQGFSSALKRYLKAKADSGSAVAAAVGEPTIETTKGPRDTVVVRFMNVIEPPLMDVGGGHKVACYLFKPAAQ